MRAKPGGEPTRVFEGNALKISLFIYIFDWLRIRGRGEESSREVKRIIFLQFESFAGYSGNWSDI
jgi:hypothetical protein